MDLISYAQNQEDVMLWRCLKHVEHGFYVDVGAADPVDLSVTYLFYNRGWSGINLEPNATYFAKLQKQRIRDVNLPIGAAAVSDERVFYEIAGTGLSTLDGAVASQHASDGRDVKELRVPCRTLAEICAGYRPEGPIHFLKIDVEGGEAEVLKGADFTRFRPWVILVEATKPLSQVPDHLEWEADLLHQGYHFVWFDGLNRFYLADEQAPALGKHFAVQPNIFDGFMRAADLLDRVEAADTYATNERAAREREFEAHQHADKARLRAEAAAQAALAALEEAGRRRGEAEQRAAAAESQFRQLEASIMQLTERVQEAGSRAEQAELQGATLQAEHAASLKALLAQAAASAEESGIRLGNALCQADAAFQRAGTAEAELAKGKAQLHDAEHRRIVAEEWNRLYRESTSWRLTRPLRVLIYLLRRQTTLRELSLYAMGGTTPRLRFGNSLGSSATVLAPEQNDVPVLEHETDSDVPTTVNPFAQQPTIDEDLTLAPEQNDVPALEHEMGNDVPTTVNPFAHQPAIDEDLTRSGQHVRQILLYQIYLPLGSSDHMNSGT
ncbi:FkbM family methyltransferase [Teichococcus vastitatis]|uniref:FkbM family methyltransferase n=1 Tax=Teichococcus vastitatis TaxID=2307076 RepID=UPI0013009DD6|nr:FkbM family methyltransferase [Pseudoroseomonas vastitatis]